MIQQLVIDYSPEYDLLWVVFLDKSGECCDYRNKNIRIANNETFGRTKKNLQ
jgi:hypothetical protein